MRINELILEQEQLDELSLAGIGRGIGATAGAIGRGVGNVQGAWQGVKAAYTQGRDASANKAARNVAHGGGAAMGKGGAPAQPTAQPTAAAPASDGNIVGGEVASNNLLARARQGTTQDFNAQPPAQAPATASPAPAAASTPEPAAPSATAPAGMKASEIVQGLTDVWGKARASQDSKTSAPQVQQLIKQMGKEAGMAGQTIAESKRVGFRSNFLGMDI
jgi:hypothetical protein